MNSPLTHAEAGDNGDLGGLSLLGVATPETTTDACSSAPQSSSATLLIHRGPRGSWAVRGILYKTSRMKTKALLALALALVWAGRAEGGVTIETITEGDGVNFPTVGKSIKVGQLPVRVSAWSCVSPSVKTRGSMLPCPHREER
jgi:hypothetical protein